MNYAPSDRLGASTKHMAHLKTTVDSRKIRLVYSYRMWETSKHLQNFGSRQGWITPMKWRTTQNTRTLHLKIADRKHQRLGSRIQTRKKLPKELRFLSKIFVFSMGSSVFPWFFCFFHPKQTRSQFWCWFSLRLRGFGGQTRPPAERPTPSDPSQRPTKAQKTVVPKWKDLHWLTALDIYIYYIPARVSSKNRLSKRCPRVKDGYIYHFRTVKVLKHVNKNHVACSGWKCQQISGW